MKHQDLTKVNSEENKSPFNKKRSPSVPAKAEVLNKYWQMD